MVLIEAAITAVLEKAFLKGFAKVTGKYLCQSLIFNKVASLRCFFGEFCTFLQYTSERILPCCIVGAIKTKIEHCYIIRR